MACNENIIKNMANEVSRNCQVQGSTVDPEFVVYLIELQLLNPKYGKLFSKTLNRNNLEYFVNECVSMIVRGEASIRTLKMQHIMATNYDKAQVLINQHLDSIDQCLKPLVTEILEEELPMEYDENEAKKLFRKISIYIILASGLGNPGVIQTLKEGMAALESVFSLEDLKVFVALTKSEKIAQLSELLALVSGVRLFNRDCKKGGDAIPDLPFDLVDASKACLSSLSNSLIAVMQRVNSLTSAIEDKIGIQEETGNVTVAIPKDSDLTEEDFNRVFDLLAFNRQYEVFTRKLLGDVEVMLSNATVYVERLRLALEELHAVMQYKAAVPVMTVFPLFTKLWQVWRAMQNEMFLVATTNRVMTSLASLQEQIAVPVALLSSMLQNKQVLTDEERASTTHITIQDRLSMTSLRNYMAGDDFFGKDIKHIQYLGFCAVCLCRGALVPGNMKIGTIKTEGKRYGFCSVRMAARFSKQPLRYIYEALDYIRNHTQLINLLNVVEDVYMVKNIDNLVVKHVPKIKVSEREVQTLVHPIESNIDINYSWNLWEWKRRACKWANVVNCQTHSTQTKYSHLRSEIHCQTFEPRDKGYQTKKDCGVNTIKPHTFLWGLQGHDGDQQHKMILTQQIETAERLKPHKIAICGYPCAGDLKKKESEDSDAPGNANPALADFFRRKNAAGVVFRE